jgi:hypothetical protein
MEMSIALRNHSAEHGDVNCAARQPTAGSAGADRPAWRKSTTTCWSAFWRLPPANIFRLRHLQVVARGRPLPEIPRRMRSRPMVPAARRPLARSPYPTLSTARPTCSPRCRRTRCAAAPRNCAPQQSAPRRAARCERAKPNRVHVDQYHLPKQPSASQTAWRGSISR